MPARPVQYSCMTIVVVVYLSQMHSCSTCVEDSGTRQVWSRNLRVQILMLELVLALALALVLVLALVPVLVLALALVLVLALVPVLVLGVFQAVEDTLFDVQNNTARYAHTCISTIAMYVWDSSADQQISKASQYMAQDRSL
ncbi:hypothetical protein E4U35_007834 [Claviceps purpurea]|nr:hypothetical protein E4U35_007834 [Claviceps purpurea]